MLNRIMNILFRELPLWLISLLTGWMPDRPMVCKLRGFLSRWFFKSCGRNFQYGPRVRFLKPENIEIGNDVYIACGCWISGSKGLTLGDEVMFGPYALTVSANHEMINGSARFTPAVGAPISIGRGSWMGAHSVILPGVNIGSGCIIAANAVVSKNVEDNCVAGGVPAKVIKQFDFSGKSSQ